MPASKTNPETAVGAMYRLILGKMLGVAAGISCMLWIFEGNVASASDQLPNIVYVLCDDLGYGDVQCLVPNTSKIPTPNADQLAAEGMVFTDAHSGSSVCTPTRYGLLTGRYSWRTRLQKGVVTGFAPCLIDASRPTVGKFLTDCGYDTAIIGKWHLDFQYLNPETGKQYKQKDHKTPPVGAVIPDGPLHRGFQYFHGFHHARNMETVIANDRVIEHDDVRNMLPRLTQKTIDYLESRQNNKKPFFLYVPLGSPHTPIVPSPEWQGKSGLGDYGDFVMQTDHVLSAINTTLHKIGQHENTILIFTSDNGCSKAADIKSLASNGHRVSETSEVQKRIYGTVVIVFPSSSDGPARFARELNVIRPSATPICLRRWQISPDVTFHQTPRKTVSVFFPPFLARKSIQPDTELSTIPSVDILLTGTGAGNCSWHVDPEAGPRREKGCSSLLSGHPTVRHAR